MTDRAAEAPFAGVRVSVIIPAMNEAKNLPHVLSQIPSWVHEVVLVDGRSTDGTLMVARALWPNRHIVFRERRRRTNTNGTVLNERRGKGITLRLIMQERRGKGAALRSGFAAATGDIIVMLDADGSTDPSEIPAYVGALVSGADFAKGSRFLQGGGTTDMPVHRRLGNWGFVQMVRLLIGGRYTDLCYGYNAFWAWTVPWLQLDGDGFEIETMMNIRALQVGLQVVEVPSFEAERIHGVGNLRTFPDGYRVLKAILREWLRPIVTRRVTPADRPAVQAQVRAALIPRDLQRTRPQIVPLIPPAHATGEKVGS